VIDEALGQDAKSRYILLNSGGSSPIQKEANKQHVPRTLKNDPEHGRT